MWSNELQVSQHISLEEVWYAERVSQSHYTMPHQILPEQRKDRMGCRR